MSYVSGSKRGATPFAATGPRRSGRTPRWWALCLASGAVSVLAGVFFGWHSDRDQVDRAVVEAAIVGVPLAVGLYSIQFVHDRRFGLLLIGAGLAWSLTALGASPDSLPYSIGRVCAWLIFPLLVYLMLAFPEGRLAAGWPRVLFGSITGLIVALYVGSALLRATPTRLHTPWAFCNADCPPNAFMVVDRQPAVMDDVVIPLRELLGVVLLAVVTWWLARRLRTASPLQRRANAPVVVMSLAWLATLVAYLVTRRAAPDSAGVDTLGASGACASPASRPPSSSGWCDGASGWASALRLRGELLGRPRDAPSFARRSRRPARSRPRRPRARPPRGRWHDSRGAPDLAGGRASADRLTVIPRDGPPDLVLAHDPGLSRDREMLDASDRAGRSMARARSAHGRARCVALELGESRERIARVADAERSRIERDLHDGAQQRLIMLRIKLSLAEELLETDPATAAEAVHELGLQIDSPWRTCALSPTGSTRPYSTIAASRTPCAARRSTRRWRCTSSRRGSRATPWRSRRRSTSPASRRCRTPYKHAAGATGLWISLREEDRLRVEILDDGPGFVPPPRPAVACATCATASRRWVGS